MTKATHDTDSKLKTAAMKDGTGIECPEVDFSWAAKLVEKPVDADRPIRVVCIGAGYSGIGSAIHMREHIRKVDFQIYDMADNFGGVCRSHSTHFSRFTFSTKDRVLTVWG
jgi:hypothetical protein